MFLGPIVSSSATTSSVLLPTIKTVSDDFNRLTNVLFWCFFWRVENHLVTTTEIIKTKKTKTSATKLIGTVKISVEDGFWVLQQTIVSREVTKCSVLSGQLRIKDRLWAISFFVHQSLSCRVWHYINHWNYNSKSIRHKNQRYPFLMTYFFTKLENCIVFLNIRIRG